MSSHPIKNHRKQKIRKQIIKRYRTATKTYGTVQRTNVESREPKPSTLTEGVKDRYIDV
jgi:hypothetical protein